MAALLFLPCTMHTCTGAAMLCRQEGGQVMEPVEEVVCEVAEELAGQVSLQLHYCRSGSGEVVGRPVCVCMSGPGAASGTSSCCACAWVCIGGDDPELWFFGAHLPLSVPCARGCYFYRSLSK